MAQSVTTFGSCPDVAEPGSGCILPPKTTGRDEHVSSKSSHGFWNVPSVTPTLLHANLSPEDVNIPCCFFLTLPTPF